MFGTPFLQLTYNVSPRHCGFVFFASVAVVVVQKLRSVTPFHASNGVKIAHPVSMPSGRLHRPGHITRSQKISSGQETPRLPVDRKTCLPVLARGS